MFDSTKELRQLIINNPDLPLAIFANECANSGEYATMSTDVLYAGIKEIALWENGYDCRWLDSDEYYDALYEYLEDTEYASEEDIEEKIDEMMKDVEFTKCIYVVVGN